MIRALYIILTLLITNHSLYGQNRVLQQEVDNEFYNATKKWFSAWELVSKETYHIEKVQPVDFIFFDDEFVYSTSNITVNKENTVKGNNLINLKLKWRQASHNGSITLPDQSVVPVQLMCFASSATDSITKSNKPFFVMPLPSFWDKQKVTSKEFGEDKLITGVFIHEFSHSQQMKNFGKKISEFEKQNNFNIPLTDNIVQNIFEENTNYVKLNTAEIETFFKALDNKTINKQLIRNGLKLMSQRQNQFFTGEYQSLKAMDDLFLTMEGLGQYSMYRWLIHPKGGNIPQSIVIQGVRRGGKQWSQDEGFALFLILEKLSNSRSWAKSMFGNEVISVN